MNRNLWQPFRSELLKLVHIARNAGKHFIMTCHEEKVYNAKGEVIGADLSIPSRLANYFGFQFTDIWRTKILQDSTGKWCYQLRFVNDGEASLKNSFGLTAPISVGDKQDVWPKLEPSIKARL
jgi:hypothetical protein